MVLPIKPIYPQAVKESTWWSLATITASAYVLLVPANPERFEGVRVYNQNSVSTTCTAYVYPTPTPTSDTLDAQIARATGATTAKEVVFVPGTGPVWVKSVNAGVLASLIAIEW